IDAGFPRTPSSFPVALDHNFQNLFLARPSVGPPSLILDGPAARAPGAAAPIGDDDDVVTPLERSAQSIRELGVLSANDQEHPPGAVRQRLCHAEHTYDECRGGLRHRRFGAASLSLSADRRGLRSRRTAPKISSRERLKSGPARTSAPRIVRTVSRRLRRVSSFRSRMCRNASDSDSPSRAISIFLARSTSFRVADASLG